MSNQEADDKNPASASETAIAHIRDALRGMRFGSINIVVQDGVVVQIDRTEKRRLARVHRQSEGQ